VGGAVGKRIEGGNIAGKVEDREKRGEWKSNGKNDY